MNRFLLPLILLAFVQASVSAQASADALKREVLQTEKKRIEALTRDDHATLARLLSDDLTYTHSTSQLESKTEFMESLTSGRVKYRAMEHKDPVVRIYGNTAIVNGTSSVKVRLNGKDLEPQLRFTLVYVKQNGEWRMAAWQSTRLQ